MIRLNAFIPDDGHSEYPEGQAVPSVRSMWEASCVKPPDDHVDKPRPVHACMTKSGMLRKGARQSHPSVNRQR
ncbi:hypothetical protein [Bacillus licheniformis]